MGFVHNDKHKAILDGSNQLVILAGTVSKEIDGEEQHIESGENAPVEPVKHEMDSSLSDAMKRTVRMLIRPVRSVDHAEWLRMRHTLWAEESIPDLVDDMQVWLREEECVALVAERPHGGLCGFLEVAVRPCNVNGMTGRFGYIEGWYVDPDVRRQGVGKSLVCNAETWARNEGCEDILSDARIGNVVSQTAHRALGFTEVERLVHFQKRLNQGQTTMQRQSYSSGTPWEKAVAYSRVVRIGNLVFVSGTTASNEDGTTVAVGNACEQARFILRKIETALAEVGAKLANVVRTRMFVTDISRWEEIGRAHGEVFAGINPVATMVEVSRLINADHLVEIEVDAVIDDKNTGGHQG